MKTEKINKNKLMEMINQQSGEFFIRVFLTEEGDMCGSKVKRSVGSSGRRTTDGKRYADKDSH